MTLVRKRFRCGVVSVVEFLGSVNYKTLLGGRLDSGGSIHAPEVHVDIPSFERVG